MEDGEIPHSSKDPAPLTPSEKVEKLIHEAEMSKARILEVSGNTKLIDTSLAQAVLIDDDYLSV